MACNRCGMPCKGQMCLDCERMEHQEDHYGTPAENMEDGDGTD